MTSLDVTNVIQFTECGSDPMEAEMISARFCIDSKGRKLCLA
jgi:hypothetical protein